ncbi:fasciclin domain-containing protein [Micromonospora krabiensis]|uniref:Uncaracterized surface protein containing fasciclin (FAS1) repeats n=1 Tax=Micromonospora krabiensis TaxID=307121 RepID=A0A1C3MZ01_9ACTN|nr:fasciclin domain-containing protein [Micromonospora krabiensis]SBV25562.1 Uncaracterized surface protein containing fasciclin (FAS1) repeats [Micromonospora krabiensis]
MSYPRTRRRLASLAAAALLLTATACTTGENRDDASSTRVAVAGPLCDALPTGSEPGNPTDLAGQPVDKALQWIPTLTTFEAALRTSGLLTDLHQDDLTLLAPTDDAFAAWFNDDTWDTLMTRDHDKLRTLVKAHLIAGTHSLDQLAAAGTATTLDGTTLTVTRSGPTTRFGDKADAVCADYQATGARIHLVNAVLGPLPKTADGTGHRAH